MTFYTRVFALVAAGVLGVLLFRIVQPFLGPILWAALLAFLLSPIQRRLRTRLRGRRGPAAALITLGVTSLVVVPALVVVALFVGQAADLMKLVEDLTNRLQLAKPGDLLELPMFRDAVAWTEQHVPVTAAQIQGGINQAARDLLTLLISLGRAAFGEAVGAIVGLALTIFLLFFFLRDGEEISGRLVRLVPMNPARKTQLCTYLAEVTRAVVLGTLLTAIVQGTLVGIAFALAGLSAPVVFGVLASLAALVPMVGSALVWVPAAVWMLIEGRWGAALFLVLWGVLLVSLVDNLVRPYFISGRAQISTLPVFIGVLGGVGAFGAIGVFLGPVVVALVLALIRFGEETISEPLPPVA
jgi:predicted PurR-regulated permease PerM